MSHEPTFDGQPTTPLLELDHLHKEFDGLVAVRDLTLHVHKGEFLSILGPSGCGKTTLLRLIAGLDVPTAGKILLAGNDIAGVPPHRRPINTVFQSYALFPHMTAFENIAFGPRTAGTSRDEIDRVVDQALELVRMKGFERALPSALSGGQQQRIALARALANRPAVLLLDEPLSALDLSLRRAMQEEIQRIHRELGGTFVLVTHDQEEAMALSHRIAVMNGGALEQVDTPEEVYRRPASPFVARFVGAANLISGMARAGAAAGFDLVVGDGMVIPCSSAHPGCRDRGRATLMVRPENVEIAAMKTPATPHQVTVVTPRFQGPTLEIVVQHPSLGTITARVHAGQPTPPLTPSASCYVGWSPESAWLLPG